MPRGDPTALELPFRTWVSKVDEANRVRIPIEVCAVVPWIDPKTGQIECVGIPGPAGGIQVAPLGQHRSDALRITEAVAETPPSASESHQKWVEAARLLATACLIPVNVEASRVSFTLPEPLRRTQQVPQAGGAAVVFAFGNILEVWDALKWYDHVRSTARRKAAVITEAIEDLGQR